MPSVHPAHADAKIGARTSRLVRRRAKQSLDPLEPQIRT
jgi:hypothetical protein